MEIMQGGNDCFGLFFSIPTMLLLIRFLGFCFVYDKCAGMGQDRDIYSRNEEPRRFCGA
jgi:hypothetical protein